MQEEWTECYSKSQQRKYYFNALTNESRWEDPRLPSSKNSTNEPPQKRLRPEIHDSGTLPIGVVTDSYQPPVSGSARDALVSQQRTLDPPKFIPELPPTKENMWSRQDIQVNPFLAKVYLDGFIVDRHGNKQKFKDVTNPIQGRHIYNIIKENKFTRTMEIGFAMGASAVWICQAHNELGLEGRHVAIDPNQTTQYESMGLYLVEQAGLQEHISLMEMTSYRAMPILLEKVLRHEIPHFQLIYIDGWHTFDYTLIDFFYADLLLDINGVIVLDDIKHIPVKRCLDYIVANYPHYQLIKQTPCYKDGISKESSQATFVKTANDSRTWNYHKDF